MFQAFARKAGSKNAVASKAIKLQAHPLDMSAPGRKDRNGFAMPQMEIDFDRKAASEPAESEVEEAPAKFCLDNLFDEIVDEQPGFATHIEKF